uniref:Uncharacterized protein n=1 Tax=Echinococcus granulosus TaxID=6210 RepID=A0A068WPD4_ECHGR|nr:hypothetical protein EgrG_002024200 [Echinococcus granulosus]
MVQTPLIKANDNKSWDCVDMRVITEGPNTIGYARFTLSRTFPFPRHASRTKDLAVIPVHIWPTHGMLARSWVINAEPGEGSFKPEVASALIRFMDIKSTAKSDRGLDNTLDSTLYDSCGG